ncbi:MAG TPA: hypothetical protein VHC23_03050 [Jatrophihabitans sp.]|nr:hypothetical protein [Jatrophihabitans sp.]
MAEATEPVVFESVTVERGRLGPLTLGVGAADGYSGSDLTNPRTAALAGEVPYLAADGSTPAADPVLELRIHGVGGAPAPDNLQSPATVQVAGDGTAGFYRGWFPGGSAERQPRREAYCWGGLNTRASSRALYLMLVGFMLVNVAHWALPGRNDSIRNRAAAAALRVLALTLTVSFFATTVTLFGDLVAWQAPARGALPSWMGWYTRRDYGPRLAIALLAVLAVLGGLLWVSAATTRLYERWDAGIRPDEDAEWPLTHRAFWCGELAVDRQRHCHVATGAAVVLLFAALPDGSADGARWFLVALAGLIALVSLVLVASPWTDRQLISGRRPGWADEVVRWFGRAAVAVAAGACVARFWWRVQPQTHALPGDQVLQVWSVVAEMAAFAVLGVAVVLLRPWRAGKEVLGFGLAAPLLAGLGCVVATIFGASLTLAMANLIGSPKVTVGAGTVHGETLLLPSTVYVGGLGMIAAVLLALALAGYLLGWSRWEAGRLGRTDDNRDPDAVLSSYPEPGDAPAVHQVAGTWARSELTDHAATALTVLTVPTAAVLTAYLSTLETGTNPGWLARLAQIGGTIGVALTLYFLATLRSAFLNAGKRKRFGFLWDVGTFWPRACHPFGPPCYAERTIPEVVTRIRRMVGDEALGPADPALAQQRAEAQPPGVPAPVEAHSPVLLTGYSQGTPIAVAVMAQLPQRVRDRMALLTLAAPIRRLYGRAFPAYFGPDQLARLHVALTADGAVRWRNLVRRSDYIGGWAFDPKLRPTDNALVDRLVYDPPVLWGKCDPSPPPTHQHSDFFPDPQARPYAIELAGSLRQRGGTTAGRGSTQAAAAGGAHQLGGRATTGEQGENG